MDGFKEEERQRDRALERAKETRCLCRHSLKEGSSVVVNYMRITSWLFRVRGA